MLIDLVIVLDGSPWRLLRLMFDQETMFPHDLDRHLGFLLSASRLQ